MMFIYVVIDACTLCLKAIFHADSLPPRAAEVRLFCCGIHGSII